jgi:hypothetical protein
MEQKNGNKRIFRWIILVITLGIIIVVIVSRSAIYKQLNSWYLLPRSETFTELYLDNYNSFPKQTVAGEKTTLTFTIHNLEASDMNYPYIVYFINTQGDKTIYSQSSVKLAVGEYKKITVPVFFNKTNETGSVVVLLTQLNQQVDILLPDNNQ